RCRQQVAGARLRQPPACVSVTGASLLAVPLVVVALLVVLLDGGPGDLVRGLLAAGVAAALGRLVVLVVGAVEGFLVDLLGVPGHVVLHGIREFGDALVGHGGILRPGGRRIAPAP